MQKWITPQLFWPENWSLWWDTFTDTGRVITGEGGLGLCRTMLVVVFRRDYYLYRSNHFHAVLGETVLFSFKPCPQGKYNQASTRSIRREPYYLEKGDCSDPGFLLPPELPIPSLWPWDMAISKLSLVSLPGHLLNIGEMFKVNNIFLLSKQMIGLFQTKPHPAVIYSCSLSLSFLF